MFTIVSLNILSCLPQTYLPGGPGGRLLRSFSFFHKEYNKHVDTQIIKVSKI